LTIDGDGSRFYRVSGTGNGRNWRISPMEAVDHGQVAIDSELLWDLRIVAGRIASVEYAVDTVGDELLHSSWAFDL